MPILPENRARYPKDWKLRSRFIRVFRARGRCEWCGVVNGECHPLTGSIVVLTTAHIFDDRPLPEVPQWARRESQAATPARACSQKSTTPEPMNRRDLIKRALGAAIGVVAPLPAPSAFKKAVANAHPATNPLFAGFPPVMDGIRFVVIMEPRAGELKYYQYEVSERATVCSKITPVL